jgi:CBS domain-containing protein
MTVHIETIMSTGISCATPDYSLNELEMLMDKQGIRCVPVIEANGKCVGVVSILDLLHWRLAKPHFGENVMAKDIITQPFESVEAGSSVEQAIEIMVSKNVHHLVVENMGKLVGILSTMDLLQNVYDKNRAINLWR